MTAPPILSFGEQALRYFRRNHEGVARELLSNPVVIHARTAYEDEGAGAGRHLLRLWLSLRRPAGEGA